MGRREGGYHPVRSLTAPTAGSLGRASTRTGNVMAWGASLVATAASTYALDAVATATGLLLTSSSLLADMNHPLLLALLGLSYLAWAVGLRANLRQNHDLLIRTGTSTPLCHPTYKSRRASGLLFPHEREISPPPHRRQAGR